MRASTRHLQRLPRTLPAGARVAPAITVTLLLFGGGLLGALRESVEPPLGGAPSTWSLSTWRALLADPTFTEALAFSLRIALLSALLSGGLALLVVGPMRASGRGVRLLGGLPVPAPHLIIAVLAVTWLAPGGLAQRALGSLPFDLIHDRQGLGIVLVYVYKETPFLVLLLLAVMGGRLREREEAAAVLGVTPAQRLRWVILPAVRRPLAIGTLIVAAFALGAFEVPLVLGPNYPPTLATYAYQATLNDPLGGQGRAAASLLVAAAASIVMAIAVVRLIGADDA